MGQQNMQQGWQQQDAAGGPAPMMYDQFGQQQQVSNISVRLDATSRFAPVCARST